MTKAPKQLSWYDIMPYGKGIEQQLPDLSFSRWALRCQTTSKLVDSERGEMNLIYLPSLANQATRSTQGIMIEDIRRRSSRCGRDVNAEARLIELSIDSKKSVYSWVLEADHTLTFSCSIWIRVRLWVSLLSLSVRSCCRRISLHCCPLLSLPYFCSSQFFFFYLTSLTLSLSVSLLPAAQSLDATVLLHHCGSHTLSLSLYPPLFFSSPCLFYSISPPPRFSHLLSGTVSGESASEACPSLAPSARLPPYHSVSLAHRIMVLVRSAFFFLFLGKIVPGWFGIHRGKHLMERWCTV